MRADDDCREDHVCIRTSIYTGWHLLAYDPLETISLS